jgi:DNA-3-methyladenine glycosylase
LYYQHSIPHQAIKRIDGDFYIRSSVTRVARDLLGKILVTRFGGQYASGRIVETEAYAGAIDRASHAYGGRRTARTEIMYQEAGTAYIYLCYGIHHMFNVVTNKKDIPHAILIRALEPLEGIEIMLQRTGKKKADYSLTRGPGNLSKALGLSTSFTGHSLLSDELYIGEDGYQIKKNSVLATPRIGVDYAGEDAALLYRFVVKDSKYLSGVKR